MIEYELSVQQDGETKERLYVIQSATKIDAKLLAVAGLLLDGGYGPEDTETMEAVAMAYVHVKEMP